MSPGSHTTMTSTSTSIHSIEKLDSTNYHAWKFKMQMVLVDKDLWDIIEGSGEEPEEESSERKSWKVRDRKALATICLSVKDSELVHVRTCKTSAEAWKKLAEVYETKGLARKLFLRRKFFTIQLQERDSMQQHINKVMTLAEQLEGIGAPVNDEDIAMTLLCSLPESYENLIIALESRADDLTAEFVQARLLQEETRRKEANTVKHEDSAFLLKNKGKEDVQKGKKKAKYSPKKRFPFKCYSCGKEGHKAAECFSRTGEGKNQDKEVQRDTDTCAAAFTVCTRDRDKWYVDSGATQHLCSKREWFYNFRDIPAYNIYLADRNSIMAMGIGTIIMNMDINGKESITRMDEVLYVPNLHGNLLSVSRLVSRGYIVIFDSSGCRIMNSDEKIAAVAIKEKNLYHLLGTVQERSDHTYLTKLSQNDISTWHQRLGHLGVEYIRQMITKDMVRDLEIEDKDEVMDICVGCIQGKQQRLPFPISKGERAKDILEIIHTDICGPMNNISLGGARYFLTFIDDKSRKTFVYFLKTKDEVFDKFKEFKSMVEKQIGKKIKILRSDNGGEYTSKKFEQYLKWKGIIHQTTVPYTPEQNGVAERANRTIVERARSMLHAKNLGYEFWAEAVATAVYLKNCSPTKAVSDKTPQEAWRGYKPTVSHLRIFGCKTWAHIPKNKRTKLDSKAVECVFVGYCNRSKGYRLYNPSTKKIIISRDVTFDERDSQNTPNNETMNPRIEEQEEIKIQEQQIDLKSLEDQDLEEKKDREIDDIIEDDKEDLEDQEEFQTSSSSVFQDVLIPRRSLRDKQPPERYGFDAEQARIAFSIEEPQSYKEAMEQNDSKEWEKAMKAEYISIMKNKTWTLTKLPPDRKAIGCKWVFKTKYNALGKIERYKARLVAKGYSQTQGIDYDETFAPVVKFNSIRILLALAAMLDLKIHQMDVNTAYLNGDLDVDIYMEQPEGFIKRGQEDKVCKLNKALYGLKQSGRVWYQKIDTYLSSLGFKRTFADNCIYILTKGKTIIIVTLYVDDFLIFSNNIEATTNLKRQLSKRFDMKDLGEAQYCLGIQIIRNRKEKTISINQTKYIENILKRFNIFDCKPIGIPLDTNSKLTKAMSPITDEKREEMKKVPYQSAVGSLMYAMLGTRPDIAYSVGVISQFNSNPGKAHWIAVKRIFRYLKGTMDYSLTYKGSESQLLGYSDADWGGNLDDRRSTTGYTFIISGGAVTWSSKKQQTVALSSTEAEYMALTQATKEAVWIKHLLTELNINNFN